jgi:hypothetical protein
MPDDREVLVLTPDMMVEAPAFSIPQMHWDEIQASFAEARREAEAEEAWAAEQREALRYRDTTNDYMEAYRDVASDATLVHQLWRGENPPEILESVKASVAEEIIRDARIRDARQRELDRENER